MGKDSRQELVDVVRVRYAGAPRAQRVRIFDEFVALTGYCGGAAYWISMGAAKRITFRMAQELARSVVHPFALLIGWVVLLGAAKRILLFRQGGVRIHGAW